MDDVRAAFGGQILPVLASKRTGQIQFVPPESCKTMAELHAALARTKSRCIETYFVVLASGQLSGAKALAKEQSITLAELELRQVQNTIQTNLTPTKLTAIQELWSHFQPSRKGAPKTFHAEGTGSCTRLCTVLCRITV